MKPLTEPWHTNVRTSTAQDKTHKWRHNPSVYHLVDDHDIVSAGEQGVGNPAADEPSRSGDEDGLLARVRRHLNQERAVTNGFEFEILFQISASRVNFSNHTFGST